jgi:hypothetical protein
MPIITGFCKQFNPLFGCFQLKVSKEEYDRLYSEYSNKDYTFSPFNTFKDVHYYVKVKVPKDHIFLERVNKDMVGKRAEVHTRADTHDFVGKDGKRAFGVTFSLSAFD